MRSLLTLSVEGDYSFAMSTVPKIICLRGLPASGKSAYAKDSVSSYPDEYLRVNRDDLRESLYGRSGILNGDQEGFITSVQRKIASDALKSGKSVIVDDMNLRNRYLADWCKFAKAHGAIFETKEFPSTVEESIFRNESRAQRGERAVPEDVIRKIAEKFLDKGKIRPFIPPMTESKPKFEVVERDPSLHRVFLVDLDGTMADIGDRSPYDTSASILKDQPREAVVRVVNELAYGGYGIIFMSGRKEAARQSTETWLDDLGHGDRLLFMRADADNRADDLVKYDLFNEHIRGKYRVIAVLDDRQRVVDMWRAIGLDCLQVAPGDF